MKTIWTGQELIFSFDDGTEHRFNIEQTKEFERWVLFKIEQGDRMRCKECGKLLTNEDCYGHDCEV